MGVVEVGMLPGNKCKLPEPAGWGSGGSPWISSEWKATKFPQWSRSIDWNRQSFEGLIKVGIASCVAKEGCDEVIAFQASHVEYIAPPDDDYIFEPFKDDDHEDYIVRSDW